MSNMDAPPSYQSIANEGGGVGGAAPPPPYHNWQDAVPDTALLPPPPTTGYHSSGTGNASASDAERAHDFCNRTPLYKPMPPATHIYSSVQTHAIRLLQANEYRGSLTPFSPGRWRGMTHDGNGDCIVISHLPLYFPVVDSPTITGRDKTIYFEVKLLRLRAGPGMDGAASGLSIGYVAQPYPSWRSPGWERGSLGVFSDDGCRFVNDSWGGKDFTTPFRPGETVGLGMRFTPQKKKNLPSDDGSRSPLSDLKAGHVEVIFTRNGQRAAGWDLHEEMDAEAGGVEGLEGDFDLYAAVGLFGGVDFEVCFHPDGWLWKPY